MTKPKKPLAGYPRVSRKGEREDDRFRSPEIQADAIKAFVKAEGFKVKMFPPEVDVSGAKASRPILDEIIRLVKAGELGGLVVAKLDRLSRLKPKERVLLFEEIEGAGGVVLSASEQLDPSSPEGRFARDVFLGIARMQWEKYAEGWERVKEGAIREGIAVNSRPAVGLRKTKAGRLEPDPEVAPIVAEVFERRAQGEGPAALGAFLESHGVRTSQGSKVWSKPAVYGLLKNRVYLGELRYGRDGRYVNPAAHDAIVDLATWTAAQHPNGRRLSKTKGAYLLAGILRCAGCRYCVQGTTTGRGKHIYRCTRRHSGGVCPEPVRVNAERMEDAAVSAFWAVTADLEAAPVESPSEELSGLEEALERAEQRLAQAKTPEMQDAAGEDWATLVRSRRQERDDAAEALGHARAKEPMGVRPSAETLRAAWERMSTAERREFLGARFDCISLGRDGRIVVYPAGTGPGDLPRRGFKRVPELRPFPDPPAGARVLTL